MLKNKENIQKSKYRIKLLADSSVVLLEADNYESEIFIPQIVNGRLTFLNIIPNRRCCRITSVAKTSSMTFVTKEVGNTMPTKVGRYSAAQDTIAMPSPLANSTPANIKHRSSSGKTNSQNFHRSNPSRSSCNSAFATPEPVRRAVTVRPQMLEKSMLNLPEGIKVARIYPKAKEGTPKKVGRLVAATHNSSRLQQSPNVSLLNGSFNLMNSSIVCRNRTQSNNNLAAVDSIAQWRKVLTPVRTYTRTSKQPVMLQRPKIVASAKKSHKPLKVKPSYLVNPTQGPNVTRLVEMKKRKLLIDAKLCISPKTFKKQQQQPLDTRQVISKSLLMSKNLRYYRDILAMSAFDLLTNSNRKSCISNKLNEQFRLGCVNKASSTYSKYKIISRVPTLQQDEQVLEISRLSISADSNVNSRSDQANKGKEI